ncbi:hypothetical protein [Lysinibacillus xylanilyticus]|uniref:hypothetical protein n=1 Tax=Lysinibacillus xylanilyticus TaxID=582475 RepID=UPI003823495B
MKIKINYSSSKVGGRYLLKRMPFNFIQQMFYVAKAKRQLQKRPVETEITPRYS